MNSSTPTPPNSSPLKLEQVDPPHPARRYALPTLVAAVVAGVAMVVFYVFVGGMAPVASGSLVQQTIFPIHVTSDPDMPGPGMPSAPIDQDQVIVLEQLQIKNLSKSPLKIFDLSAQLSLPQKQINSLGASAEDIDRLFQAYPKLASLRTKLLARHEAIAPGETAEGLAVFNYSIPQEQWGQRRDLKITVSFESGLPVVLHTR